MTKEIILQQKGGTPVAGGFVDGNLVEGVSRLLHGYSCCSCSRGTKQIELINE